MTLLKKIIPDDKCNMIILIWPSMHKKKLYWKRILDIFYKTIMTLLKNKNYILIIEGKNDNVKKEIENFYRRKKYSHILEKNNLIEVKKYIHILKYNCNDIWIRDFGPQLVEFKKEKSYSFYEYTFNGYGNQYLHDRDKGFSKFLINQFKKEWNSKNFLLSKKPFYNLIVEGGNIQCNNQGTIIFNKRCLQKNNDEFWENIKPYFDNAIMNHDIRDYLYIDSESITGDDTNGHLDNLIRFHGDYTLLYMSSDDTDHPDFHLLKDLKEQLMILNKKTSLIKKLIPINHTSKDIIKNNKGAILPFSYLNYIVTNNIVIFPKIKNHELQLEKQIQSIFFNKKVFFMNVEGLLNEFGGLHCCTLNAIY